MVFREERASGFADTSETMDASGSGSAVMVEQRGFSGIQTDFSIEFAPG